MILRFTADATLEERAAVERALRDADVRAIPAEGALVLRGTPSVDVLAGLAALAGVEGIGPGERGYTTLRVSVLGWISAACAVLGLLTIVAANFPAPLGTPADPLRTPETLRSSWPLLPIHGLVESAPDWLPVSLLPALALGLLIFWPLVARGLARRTPWLHAVIGAAAILTTLALAVLEVAR